MKVLISDESQVSKQPSNKGPVSHETAQQSTVDKESAYTEAIG